MLSRAYITMHMNNILSSDECVSSAGLQCIKYFQVNTSKFIQCATKPAKWSWRVRQGTWTGRVVPAIFIILDVSCFQLLFPNWKTRIMPRSVRQYLLYLFSVYRLAFFLKRRRCLNYSPCERKVGLPTL